MSEKQFKRRFFRQLAWTYFFLCFCYSIAFCAAAMLLMRSLNDRTLAIEHWHLAKDLAAELQPFVEPTIDLNEVNRVVARLRRYAPTFKLCLLDSEGHPQIIPVGNVVVSTAPLEAALADRAAQPERYSISFGRQTEIPFSVARLTIAGNPGYVLILLREDRFSPTAMLLAEDSGVLIGLIFFVIAYGISILISLGIFHFLTRNLYQIVSVVRSYRDGVFSRRVQIRSANELGELGAAVNEMADRIVESMEELERRDAVRRDLVANISHDLRAPAAGILGLADTLALRRKAMSDADFSRCIEGIIDSGEALSRLIAELFDLSRFESGDVHCEMESVELQRVLQAAITRIQVAAEKKGVKVACSVEPELSVRCDPHLIGRALDNLLGNALKFTASGGLIELKAESMPGMARISVQDSGSGIPKEDLQRIFDRHERASEAGDGFGLGLGLAIVSQIIKLHEHSISVESEVGKGSRFSFSLDLSTSGSPA